MPKKVKNEFVAFFVSPNKRNCKGQYKHYSKDIGSPFPSNLKPVPSSFLPNCGKLHNGKYQANDDVSSFPVAATARRDPQTLTHTTIK
jgi:hypothetical protein